MQAIFDFFSMVGDIIVQAVQAIINFVNLLFSAVSFVPQMIGWMPPLLLSLFVGIVGIIVIKLIVGR